MLSDMKLPDGIKVSIHVKSCKDLGWLRARDLNITDAQRNEAKEEYENAYRALCTACTETEAEVPDARTENTNIPTLQRCLDELRVARSHVLALPDEDELIRPNPCVVITLEHDELVPENAYTDVLRARTDPIWEQKIEPMSLADLVRQSNGYQNSLESTALMFSVYHDDAVCEGHGAPAKDDDEKWRRDSPQRDVLLAFAKWNFVDIKKLINRADENYITLKLQYFHKNADSAQPEISFRAQVTLDAKCVVMRWGHRYRRRRKKSEDGIDLDENDGKHELKHEDKIRVIAQNEAVFTNDIKEVP